MSNIVKKSSKILLIILIALICAVTITNAGVMNPLYVYDRDLANAAVNATKGINDEYFNFDARTVVGKNIKDIQLETEQPYNRQGQYCIDNRSGVSGNKVYTIKNIIDITPEGKVISYKSDGNNIETAEQTTVDILKQLSYASQKSIEAEEGRAKLSSWKVTIQLIIAQKMGLFINQLGLDKSFDELDTPNISDVQSTKLSEAETESKNKAYQGRFVFLYGNGGQNQIIFGAKEGKAFGDLKIVKNGANKKLPNVSFILKNTDTNEYVSNDYADKVADYTTDRNAAKTFVTDSNGEINIKGLKLGNYELYETANQNYGYVIDPSKAIKVTIKSGSNISQVINELVYVKLSGYVWVDEIDGKTSTKNNLFKENDFDTNDILLDGITVRLKDSRTGETIKETKTSELGRYTDSRNNGHGEYLFEDVLVKDLEYYYVEFEYEGLTYQNVISNLNKDNGSKAIENVEVRNRFNNKFSVIEGETENTGFTRNEKGNKTYSLSYNIDKTAHTSSLIKNEQFLIQADTRSYKLKDNFTGQEEIRYVNLGLYEREQPDIALVKDIENVRLTINGYGHTYFYAQRNVNAGEYNNGFNVGVKFGNEYGKLKYSRPVYKADYEYDAEDNSKELKVYVTYKIAINNQSTNLITKVNSIVDYYDKNYTIVNAGTSLNENGTPKGDIKYSDRQEYNDKYEKTTIESNKEIAPQTVEIIYVQFELNKEAVLKVLNDGENLDNVAEVNSYSVFDTNGRTYAGIDIDSSPGNVIPGDKTTYQDDTDSAPGLKLETTNAREMTGKVFLDSTSGELKTGEIRQGSGIYEDGEKGIEGVKVTLTENSGSGKVYTATTNANGEFKITGFIPGDYTVTYTWGDETYTVSNYKGTIYKDQTREQNPEWYKQLDPRYSDAIDNYQTRLEIDEELKVVNKDTKTTKTTMDSTTPIMKIGVEYDTTYTASTGDRYTYEIKNIDFGIVERARQDIKLTKRVKTIKLTLANGQVIVDVTIDENGNLTGEKKYVTYMGPSKKTEPKNGYVKIELDNELIQGATLEVIYEIKGTNISELDYLSEKFYKYGIVEGERVKLRISGTIDYLDDKWAFEESEQWQVKTAEEIKDIVKEEVIVGAKDKTILYTESLSSQELEPNQSVAIDLNTTKVLANNEEINLNNEAEIAEITKNGGAKTTTTPGNYVPGTMPKENDETIAEEVIVTPNTGENLGFVIPTLVGIISAIILVGGVIFIKKKVLR